MDRILVVEDEPRIGALLRRALEGAGYAVESAGDGRLAIERARTGRFDLVLLDLMLPEVPGIAVLREVMARDPEQPVMVLSAVPDVQAKVRCLDLGAADYVTKPFDLAEVLARIRVRLRGPAAGGGRRRSLQVREVFLDMRERSVDAGRGPVRLADREFSLLWTLAERAGEVCPRADLLREVWGGQYDDASKVLEVCVGRLRSKLGKAIIETVRHEGYRFGMA